MPIASSIQFIDIKKFGYGKVLKLNTFPFCSLKNVDYQSLKLQNAANREDPDFSEAVSYGSVLFV